MAGRRTIVVFAGCVALLVGGVAWISVTALRSGRAEERARRAAALEENVRLGLWRLDSELMPLVALESTRPAFAAALPPGPHAHVRGYFRVDAGRLEPVATATDLGRLAALAPAIARATQASPATVTAAPPAALVVTDPRGAAEWQARNRIYQQAESCASIDNNAYLGRDPATFESEVMTPAWVEGELVLVRPIDGHVEGVWLDWPELRGELLGQVASILPGARLEPVRMGERGDAGRFLAALPLVLLPGPPPRVAAAGAPLHLVLGIAWSGVGLAIVAGVALLAGALLLSERRAAFVSAVTHELRTPLTTFRTYTEMLSLGMVTDEAQKAQYVETLHREAGRLAHLVENVLLFARVERGRGGQLTRPVDVAELLERTSERLRERAAAAGMTLELAAVPEGLTALADAGAVEQILFNLVDNACKYAASANDRRIEIAALASGGDVVLSVADHGPGIAPVDRAALFRSFGRSAAQAAGNAPGVGLGLALCRRLARAMRGELVLADGPGATFRLRLRAA